MTQVYKNTDERYGLVARGVHWVMALLVLGLLVMGFYMGGLAFSPAKLDLYMLHKSVGLLVLGLVILRVAWRFISKPPSHLETHRKTEVFLSKTIQVVFYIAMFSMPLSGWIMSNAGGHPFGFFGLFEMPKIVGENKALAGVAREAHEVIAFVLIGSISLHILGALKHHLFDRDKTLIRMGANMWIVLPFLLLFAGVLYFSAQEVLGKLLSTAVHDSPESTQSVSDDSAEQDAENASQTVSDAVWVIDGSQSAIDFEFIQYGQPISGSFGEWDADIKFDPDNLDGASVRVQIDPASIRTGSDDRNEQAKGDPWFNVAAYPWVVFESTGFSLQQGNQYEVRGVLTIRDTAREIAFPFTLDIEEPPQGGELARMHAMLSLSRLDFGVGQGEWQSTDAIGEAVHVNLQVVAHSKTP